MALMSDAVMVIYCDVSSDVAGHDDWHTYEHMHERLSIPGFFRGSRWTRTSGSPRYMIFYEVADLNMATSPEYLQRLNNPSEWTSTTMKRLGGMSRGLCNVIATAGYGLGHAALSLRIPQPLSAEATRWLIEQVKAIASWRGMASVHLFVPAPHPPMTKEQSIRGDDTTMGVVLLATAHDTGTLVRACEHHLGKETLERNGIAVLDRGMYELGFTATATEVLRTPANRPLTAEERKTDGSRNA